MKRALLALTFAAALASAPTWAHEGHAHKVMGTVCAIDAQQIEVKATNGKTETLTLTNKTKVLRGRTAFTVSDIRAGDRVVVTATETKGKDGKTSLIASRVQLGTASTPSAEPCAAPASGTQRVH